MPPKRGRPFSSVPVIHAAFTMQVRAPGGGGTTLTLRVPRQADPAAPDRSPQAVERLEYVAALGLVVAFKKGTHAEYPIGQILQMELAEAPVGDDEAEAAE